MFAELLSSSRVPLRYSQRGNPYLPAKEQFLCHKPAQDSAPSAVPLCGIAFSYFESRRGRRSCTRMASKLLSKRAYARRLSLGNANPYHLLSFVFIGLYPNLAKVGKDVIKGEIWGKKIGCVPPFTHSVVSRAVQLMMPTVS